MLPLIRNENGEDARSDYHRRQPGRFLSANEYFKHPDLFRGVIAMSGSYDIRSYWMAITTTTSSSITRSSYLSGFERRSFSADPAPS